MFNKSLIGFIAFFLFFTSAVQTYMTLWHEKLTDSNDLNRIINEIRHFDFLLKPEFNFSLAFIIFTLALFFAQFYKYFNLPPPSRFKKAMILFISFCFVCLLIASVFQTINDFMPDGNIRFYPPLIALPFVSLFWWIYEKNKVNINRNKLFFIEMYSFLFNSCFLQNKF